MENQNTNVKVVLRTRPTPSFAIKNIALDALENVIFIIKLEHQPHYS